MKTNMHTIRYKELTKSIKKRVKQLKNDRLKDEAEKINEYANKRKIEQLFKEIKSKNSAFKELRSSSNCDPDKLKKHFEHHFNTNLDKFILSYLSFTHFKRFYYRVSSQKLLFLIH